jgi:mono/diheme cytochrome c family protein
MPEVEKRRHPMLLGVLIVIGIEILVCSSLALVVVFGGFSMNADAQPGALEAWLGSTGGGFWVGAHAPSEKDPVPVDDGTLTQGARLYQGNCAVCHGGAGYTTSNLHKGVYPGAPQFLTKHAMKDPDGNIFYVIKHGIRFTGMPAWQYNMSDNDIWTLVDFLKHIDSLPPEVRTAWQQMPMSPALPLPAQPQ